MTGLGAVPWGRVGRPLREAGTGHYRVFISCGLIAVAFKDRNITQTIRRRLLLPPPPLSPPPSAWAFGTLPKLGAPPVEVSVIKISPKIKSASCQTGPF